MVVDVDLSDILSRAAASLGYSKLKPEQEKAITAFVRGNDVFVALPTGYSDGHDLFLVSRASPTSKGA